MSATLKPDLRDRIAGLSAITTAGARVSIDRNPQNTDLPRIRISRREWYCFPTLGTDTDSLIREQFQIDVRGQTSQDAEELAQAVTGDLQTLRGNLGTTRKVVDTQIDSQSDDFEPDEYGGDAGSGMVSVQCTILHKPQSE